VAHGWPVRHQEALSALLARPFWITISLGAFILGLSFIYSPLVGGEAGSFLPFVAFGFIAWQFISQLVLDGCTVFIANGPIIQQLQAPLSIYIYQTVWRHLIILAHNLLIYVLIALTYGLLPSWQTLLVVPGIILVGINGISIGMLLGTLSARFHDIPPIVQTITQMMFLLTPILCRPDQVPGRELFYLLNPFYYLVEIIREPLEGSAPSLFIWTVVLAVTAAGFVVSLLFFSRFRNRIVYLL
jgi:ABC-type polysaccharide/polyol phosphate export permease